MNMKLKTLAFTLALVPLLAARGDIMVWTNAAGGSFHDPVNWQPNAVPFTNDTAVFELTNAPYTVTWNENVTNHTHIVRAGTVTFDLQGYTYSLNLYSTNTLGTTSQTAMLTVTNGTIRRLNPAYVGGAQYYYMRGTGTTLHLRNAKFRQIAYYFSMPASTRLIVDGPSADFYTQGYSSLGKGTIIVTNGAYLQAEASLRFDDGSRMHVHGPGYRAFFTVNSAGMAATASMLFDNGAEVRDGYWSSVNPQPIGGTITLDNALWYDSYGDATRGKRSFNGPSAVLQGTGLVKMQRIILNGGSIRPGCAQRAGLLAFTGIITNTSPDSRLEFELGGPTTNDYDRIKLTASTYGPGILHAGGALDVTALDEYVPVKATTFKIIDAVSIEPVFDQVNLPAWTGTWVTNDLYTAGEITYIPPPGGTTLMLR